MCGCNKQITTVSDNSGVVVNSTLNENCSYSLEELNSYKVTLYCLKDKELYNQTNSTEAQINRYLGTVTSAIYYPSNLCYYEDTLNEIKNFLTNTDLSTCNYV